MTWKFIARKHVHAPPCRNVVPTESYSDGQNVGYFLRTLRTLLLALGYNEPPLFIGILRLLRGNSYLWRVRVVIYERPTTDHICLICQVIESHHTEVEVRGRDEGGSTRSFGRSVIWSEWTNEHSQYRQFPSWTEGAEAGVLPAGDHDHNGCFTDQVKSTRAMVQDLDEAIKEVKLLREHEEESS
jgi:hypothetical protein